MFNDSETVSAGFESSWKVSKSSTDSETQTKEIKGMEKHEQTTFTESREVQTDEVEKPINVPKFDEKALAAFLVNIYPKVEKELSKMEKGQAFASYILSTNEEHSENVTELYTLPKPKEPSDSPVKVTALSWSCTGNILAVACAAAEHSDWCNHGGSIRLFKILRSDSSEPALSRVIETSSCVLSISMHPYEPSIIAAGTFSGEVIIWKIQDDDVNYIIGSSEMDSHSEPVKQVEWVRSATLHQEPILVSAALDGHMMTWHRGPHSSTFKLQLRYVMGNDELSTSEPGISCFSFSPKNPSQFIVGVEGGQVYSCHVNAAKTTSRIGCSSNLMNPVMMILETVLGTVTSIAFSPYQDDTFATTGTDLQIRLYVLHEYTPHLIIWCDMDKVGLQWSRTQANILLAWGNGGEVGVYDALTGHNLRNISPTQDEQNKTSQLLNAAQFNKKRPQLLAVGDVEGYTRIWKIPTKFSVNRSRADYREDK